jgi:hypothetical protein
VVTRVKKASAVKANVARIRAKKPSVAKIWVKKASAVKANAARVRVKKLNVARMRVELTL